MKKILIIQLMILLALIITLSYKEVKSKTTNKYKEISYYNSNNLNRYLSYHKKNKHLSHKEIVEIVNMNLDIDYYDNPQKALYKNTDIVLVNKHYFLEQDYTPDNLETVKRIYSVGNMRLVRSAKIAFEQLSEKAKEENLNIIAMSTYRSYDYQKNLYNKYVQIDGIEKADTYSARPGYSEHQTGLALDVCNKTIPYTEFENTEEFQWMKKHAHEYGFILRFPKGKERETGYEYEAWHYRYVGIKTATYIKNNNITLEKFIAKKKPLNRG